MIKINTHGHENFHIGYFNGTLEQALNYIIKTCERCGLEKSQLKIINGSASVVIELPKPTNQSFVTAVFKAPVLEKEQLKEKLKNVCEALANVKVSTGSYGNYPKAYSLWEYDSMQPEPGEYQKKGIYFA